MELKDIEKVKAVDLMTAKPVIASPDETLSVVIGRMKKKDVHEVLVVRDGEFLGLVSYDFLIRRRGLPPSTKVEHVLTHVTHVEDQTTLPHIAETVLSTGVRALPVKKKEKLVGVVSRTDLVRSILKFEELAELATDSVMSHSVQCVYENDMVSRARHLIQELEARSIPVIDEFEHLVGVVGLKDIAPLVIQPVKRGEDAGLETGPLDVQVKSIMSSPPISVTKDASISKVIKLMAKHDVSNIAVVEKDIPIGIVTQIDLVELLVRFRKGDEVYVQISGLEEGPEVYDAMYEMMGKTLRRIGKIVTPKVFNVHMTKYHTKGDSFKHSIRARMTTENEMYYARSHDWDLFSALEEMLDQLERNVKREKERRLDKRKRRKKS